MARALSPDLTSSNSTVTWVSYPYSCWQTSKGARWLQNPFELQRNKLPVPAWLLITIGFTLLQPLHSHFDSKTNGNPINPRITCSSCATKKNWPLQQGLAHVFLISPLTFQVQLPKSVALRWCDFLPPLPPLASPRETRSLRVSCDSWNSHWQQFILVNQFHMICQFGDLVICFENQLLCLWGSFCLCGIFLGKIAGWPSKQCGFAWAKRLRLRNRGETDNWIVHVRVGAWVVSCHQIGMGK